MSSRAVKVISDSGISVSLFSCGMVSVVTLDKRNACLLSVFVFFFFFSDGDQIQCQPNKLFSIARDANINSESTEKLTHPGHFHHWLHIK